MSPMDALMRVAASGWTPAERNYDAEQVVIDALERIAELEAENAKLQTTVQNLNNLLVVVKDNWPKVFKTISEALDELEVEQSLAPTTDPQG